MQCGHGATGMKFLLIKASRMRLTSRAERGSPGSMEMILALGLVAKLDSKFFCIFFCKVIRRHLAVVVKFI